MGGIAECACGCSAAANSGNLTFRYPARSWFGRVVGGIRECACGCSAGANSGNNGVRYPATFRPPGCGAIAHKPHFRSKSCRKIVNTPLFNRGRDRGMCLWLQCGCEFWEFNFSVSSPLLVRSGCGRDPGMCLWLQCGCEFWK